MAVDEDGYFTLDPCRDGMDCQAHRAERMINRAVAQEWELRGRVSKLERMVAWCARYGAEWIEKRPGKLVLVVNDKPENYGVDGQIVRIVEKMMDETEESEDGV